MEHSQHTPVFGRERARVRLCFISYPHLTRLAMNVLGEYADRAEIEVVEASFGSALQLAREREKEGRTHAFVSAGSNAMILREALSTPVSVIRPGGYDLMLALMKAQQYSDRVGVISFRETIPELDAIRDVLRIDVRQLSYRTPDEARARVSALVADGYPVIVGSSLAVELAEEQGARGVLGYSLLSVRQGLEAAVDLGRVAMLEAMRYGQLDGVLRSLQEAVLAVDRNNAVIAVNPQMEALLSVPKHRLIGNRIDKIDPVLSLQSVLESGVEEHGQVVLFSRREWLVNRTPVREGNVVTGAVMTLYDANVIREADTSLRSERGSGARQSARYSFQDLDGRSPELEKARSTARRYALTDLTVLINGESGTGKEVCAQAIHRESARADKPFIAVNCAAFPEALLESELFGYEEGAFTGSRKGGKRGLFEAAHTGTLFLDEIGDMPLTLQTRLLRVLQEREVLRVGGVRAIPVDVRIIAATHQPLDRMVAERRFRADLFYRVNVLQLSLPALRNRRQDVVSLAERILARSLKKARCDFDAKSVLAPLLPRLCAYSWPGNVRELENICERMAVFFAQFQSQESIAYDALFYDCPELLLDEAGSDCDADAIQRVLSECGNSKSAAARRLGISRATLWRRLRELHMDTKEQDPFPDDVERH